MKHTERKTLSKSSGWLGILALLICACTPVPEHCGDFNSIAAGASCPGNPGGQTHNHTWGGWVVTTPATCTAPGVETRTCQTDVSHKETRATAQLTGSQCSGGGSACVGGVFTDARDNKTYKCVKIGNQTWMAENLNYNASGSVCYENSPDSCAKYGRLYDWDTVMGGALSSSSNPSGVRGICPAGWHVPSDNEWAALGNNVGGWKTAGTGTKLKSKTGWYSGDSYYKAGTDDYGFSALPGGIGRGDYFLDAGSRGNWWSATDYDAGFALYWYMDNRDEYLRRFGIAKTFKYSLRCLQGD